MKNKKLQIGLLDFSSVSRLARSGKSPAPREIQVLRNAIKLRGHVPVIYKVPKCQMYFHEREAEILYNNKKIKGCDVLIPRVSITSNLTLEVSIVKQFQLMGMPVINGYLPVQRAKNKLRTLQILTQRNLPVPRTVVVRQIQYIDAAIECIGGYPVILKSPYGSFGAGVVIVESRRSLYSALDVLWMNMKSNILLIQEYVAEADGSDYRAFVIGNRVVASMKRTAQKGEFRSNLHLGGQATAIELTPDEQKIAIRATRALNLQIAGVDILRSKDGPIIMEVNANPGFLGLMEVTGVDVAGEIVDFAAKLAEKSGKEKV
ncbi:RimK family alpha-L-glutamate ligase [Patescibacteria group bacterium]|nr:RimK family alpha-L-glutamate ligase [Patescibacteria group bacterium]MBU1953781.1 RimK family alpha-L-glutamate ligase [Patescibacteria group bacterium]